MGTLAKESLGNITPEVVAAAARRGDQAARRVLEEVGTNLGLGVANIVSLLNPEVVVLGGGLAGIGNLLLAPLRKAVRQWGQPLARRQVRIVISRLGDEAGILGAARHAFLKMEEMTKCQPKPTSQKHRRFTTRFERPKPEISARPHNWARIR
jgi:predicted NBD/HSP70 family sugar kinase